MAHVQKVLVSIAKYMIRKTAQMHDCVPATLDPSIDAVRNREAGEAGLSG